MTLILKVKILPDENDDLKASPLGRKITGAISPVMKYSRVMSIIKNLNNCSDSFSNFWDWDILNANRRRVRAGSPA